MPKQMKDTRIDAAPLRSFMSAHKLTHKGMGDLCRHPSSTISTWLRLNKMPPYMLVILEGLTRRQRAETTQKEVLALMGTKLELEPFENMARMSGIPCKRIELEG